MASESKKKEAAAKASSSPAAAKSPPSSSAPATSGLALNQKLALIAAAALIAIVLAIPLFTAAPPMQPEVQVTSQVFGNALVAAPTIGIFMDARGVDDASQKQKLFQCGADLASGMAGSAVLGAKSRIVAACDDQMCILSYQAENRTLNATPSEVLSAMGATVYIHIKGQDSGSPIFYSNRMEFPVSKLANATCSIGATEQAPQDLSIFPSNPEAGAGAIPSDNGSTDETIPAQPADETAPSEGSGMGETISAPADDTTPLQVPAQNGSLPADGTGEVPQ